MVVSLEDEKGSRLPTVTLRTGKFCHMDSRFYAEPDTIYGTRTVHALNEAH